MWPFEAGRNGDRRAPEPRRGLKTESDTDWKKPEEWEASDDWKKRDEDKASDDWKTSDAWKAVLPPIRARNSNLNAPADAGSRRLSLGFLPDLPDHRDRVFGRTNVVPNRDEERRTKAAFAALEAEAPRERVSNARFCSPVEDQGRLGSCTAQAVVGLMEYMQRWSDGSHVDGSRLFVYKVTRKLLGWDGDTGAHIRAAMKAIAAFGVPPEQYWPYDTDRFDEEPAAFHYSFAASYKALNYTRLDPPDIDSEDVIANLERVISAGLPVAFGFSVFSSLSDAPDIPVPGPRDALQGGHAVLAVGYDRTRKPLCGRDAGKAGDGALLIRNSWGTEWGMSGYGFLPYEYIRRGLALDFWTAMKVDWLEKKAAAMR